MHLVGRTDAAFSEIPYSRIAEPSSPCFPKRLHKGLLPLNNYQWKTSNALLIKKVASWYHPEGFATGRSLAM